MDALPEQVRLGAEAADRIMQGLSQPPTEAPSQATDPQEVQPSPAADATAAQPASEQPKPIVDEASWEHRYKTLQGMFASQKQRHEDAIREKDRSISDLLARVTALEGQAPKPAAPQVATTVTDKDVDTFGADLIDLAKRVSADTVQQYAAEVKAMIGSKDAEIAELRRQLGGVAEQTKVVSQATYMGELTKLVPDWEAVNTSKSWLEWLAEIDPLTGKIRQDHLDTAFASQDVQRTAQIFNAFKATRPAQTAPQTPPDLARQVQPATSQAAPSASSATAASRIWTAAEIGRFYDDLSRGAYRGKEQEAARINAEIDAALATGRVR